ncbi:ketopantoate reductase PanE/ApbA-domain-containing protein [Dipodascopsis uninucleata]
MVFGRSKANNNNSNSNSNKNSNSNSTGTSNSTDESRQLRILSVGSNPVSAFLSWRLAASNVADVALVWKSQFDIVYNFGISFKSSALGTERYRPKQVVKAIDEIVPPEEGYDYVLLCVKALPDVYDLSTVIAPVVKPGHTCIIINTSVGIGIEQYLEDSFRNNVILSVVVDSCLSQTGPAEFEQTGSLTPHIWIGANTKNSQRDISLVDNMANSFALTLQTGSLRCTVSKNIRQQQWENSIGPIALHPLSVIMDEPSLPTLLEQPRIKSIATGIARELVNIAVTQDCTFEPSFATSIIESSISSLSGPAKSKPSIMYQDYSARRPMQVEVMVSNPLAIADKFHVEAPRLEFIHLMLSRINNAIQSGTAIGIPGGSLNSPVFIRQSSYKNGSNSGTVFSPSSVPMSAASSSRRMQSQPQMGSQQQYSSSRRQSSKPRRRPSLEGLEELSDLVAYADAVLSPNGALHSSNSTTQISSMPKAYPKPPSGATRRTSATHVPMVPSPQIPQSRSQSAIGGTVEESPQSSMTEYFSAVSSDNLDMLSVTSRRNRRNGSAIRNMKSADPSPGIGRSASSTRLSVMASRKNSNNGNDSSTDLSIAALEYYESFIDSPIISYTSDRYHTVDTRALTDHSRSNSLSSGIPRPMYPPAPAMPQSPQPTGLPFRPSGYRYSNSPIGSPGASPAQARQALRSMMPGPSAMDALMGAVSSPGGLGATSNGSASNLREVTILGKHSTAGQSSRSLTGSASASTNENGSHSSSASSLEQK